MEEITGSKSVQRAKELFHIEMENTKKREASKEEARQLNSLWPYTKPPIKQIVQERGWWIFKLRLKILICPDCSASIIGWDASDEYRYELQKCAAKCGYRRGRYYSTGNYN